MQLVTLGDLRLGQSFRRETPLLLLSYLTLEGEQSREHLADLFWQHKGISKEKRRNNLSRVLSDLRKYVPGSFDADNTRIWALVECDVARFRRAFEAKDYQRALTIYSGTFLKGYDSHWGLEFEDWLFEVRSQIEVQARQAALLLAEREASLGLFPKALEWVKHAYQLAADPPPPELLGRFYTLLKASDHPLAREVQKEAADYGLHLELSVAQARLRLQPSFIGREQEQLRLGGLAEGSWFWLKGAEGMGKTSLLKSLSGTYLPARFGLPYATLEPLVGQVLSEGQEAVLRFLSQQEGTLLFDDWHYIDPESRELIERLHKLKPKVKVIIASAQSAPFNVGGSLELSPLTEASLAPYPEAWPKTGGMPHLVGAYLRAESLETALEERLASLPADTRDIYLSLALLGEPDLSLLRSALRLDAATLAKALDTLVATGFTEPSGQPKTRVTALHLLELRPSQRASLALNLARKLRPLAAFELYQLAKGLWTDEDYPLVQQAYLAQARELLRRGFPQRVNDVLADAPPGAEVSFLKARSLERSGHFQEALGECQLLSDTPEVLALKGALYWRLGRYKEAWAASQKALKGKLEARAEGNNTLSHLARSQGRYEEALRYTQCAETLWLALGEKERRLGALINQAVTETLMGLDAEASFEKALEVASGNPLLESRVLNNLGWMHERDKQFAKAEDAYRQALKLTRSAGDISTAARIQNNLGVLFHKQKELSKARKEYEQALHLAQQAGDQHVLGMSMANLAELDLRYEVWLEALRILEVAGYSDEARLYRDDLPEQHPFRNYN